MRAIFIRSVSESAKEQIECFRHELEFFVEMTAAEQTCQLSDDLPSAHEYQRRRMGSSAVGVCLALAE